MPNWTPENELKLATAIIALHQIKVSQSDCERLATIIGDGCTAKAITHRVGKFRESASKLDLKDGPATPSTGRKRGRKAQQNGEVDSTDAVTPTKKPRTPKAKKVPAPVIKEEHGSQRDDEEEQVKKKDVGGDDGDDGSGDGGEVKQEVSETEVESTGAVNGDD